jgi:4-hydroxybenzoate polyprenyltransferase
LVVSVHRALAAPAALPDAVDVSEGAPPPRAIWWAFALHAALGLGFSAWLLNPTAGYLSLVPTVAILAAAALRKRTAFAHVLLGAGLAAAPPGAYYALTGACDVGFYGATMFGCGVLAWAAGLDVLWSLQPRFRTPGAPAAFPYPMSVGRLEARSLARLVQLAALAFFASARATLGFDRFYFVGVGAAAACLVVAHRRQRAPDASDVGPEFLRWNLAVGPCLFVGALLGL